MLGVSAELCFGELREFGEGHGAMLHVGLRARAARYHGQHKAQSWEWRIAGLLENSVWAEVTLIAWVNTKMRRAFRHGAQG